MKNLYEPAKVRKVAGVVTEESKNGGINIVVVIVLSVFLALASITLIYVFLKFRGKICKKRGQVQITL